MLFIKLFFFKIPLTHNHVSTILFTSNFLVVKIFCIFLVCDEVDSFEEHQYDIS